MPEYVKYSLIRFQHRLQKLTDQPHKHTIPVFGATIQYTKAADMSNKLDDDDTHFIQQVTVTFLYYARAVDPKMLIALIAISPIQAAPTKATMDKEKHFLDYEASHPDAILSYSASVLVVAAHINASYLTEPKARSRAGGHFFMSNNASNPGNNGAVFNISLIIKKFNDFSSRCRNRGTVYQFTVSNTSANNS